MVIKQVKGAYQTKYVRIRAYRNLILEMLENFEEHNFTIKSRDQNSVADSLVVSTSIFTIPIHHRKRYEVEARHRPAIPDNITNWQMFDSDQQVINFLELKEEFENIQVCQQNMFVKTNANSKFIQLKKKLYSKSLIPL